MVGKKRMTTTQGITTASGTRIHRIAQMNALADVVVNVYAPVMKQGSIIVTPTASAETTCSHGSPRASGSSIPSAVSTA